MANFPKYHGITLAANSFIENLVMERLASDPVPVSAGRLWYNTTDKVIKYSGLDAGGAVVVEVIASGAAATALASRVTTLEGLVSTIQGAMIKKDGSVAFTGDQSAGGFKLTNVATPVDGSDAANKDFVLNSIAVLGNAFEYVGTVEGGATAGAALDMALQTQKASGDYYKVATAGYFKVGTGTAFYANVGDGLIFNTTGTIDKIDNTDSNVAGTSSYIEVTGSADTGFTVDIAAAFKTRMTDAEGAITAEVTRATGAEGALDSRLDTAEVDITTLQGRATTIESAATTLAGRVTASEGDVTTLQGRATAIENAATTLAGRVTTNEGNITSLNTTIGSLSSLSTTDKTSVVNAINEVATAAGEGTGALKTAINAQRYVTTTAAPALTHVITHNLNTAYPSVTIMVKGDDNVFRNDIVAYEETDANTITVYLTEARVIKVSAQNISALA